MFVARVPATGSVAWERAFGTAGPDVVDALAYRDGIVYFGGHYGGMIDFDGTILTNGGDDDGFIAIASATDGKVTKAVGFGSTGEEVVSALDVNPAGEVVACGVFGGTVDFLGQDGVSNGGGDLFVMKLTTALTLDWLVTFGGGSDDVFRACAFDDDGGVLATGRFGSAVDFGTGTFTSEGNDDSVILRLAP